MGLMSILVLTVHVAVIDIISKCMSASSAYPVYRNHNEEFRNLAATSDYVYIGGNSMIIQLSPSLISLPQKNFSINGLTSKYRENWLLSTPNNESLIVCNFNSTFDTLCLKLNSELSVVSNSSSLIINKPAIKYLTTTNQNTTILIIASSMCLSNAEENKTCNSISSYSLDTFLQRFQPYTDLRNRTYAVEYLHQTKHVTFKAIVKIEKFTFFLFNTVDGRSKLGKMCTGSLNMTTNTFEDTPIMCSHNGKHYTLANDAMHWNGYLFVVFSDESINVICKYKITNVKVIFMKSRQERLKCPYNDNTKNAYFKKQTLAGWCFNQTTRQCQSDLGNHTCPELTGGFCDTIVFGSVEGTLPITEDEIVYSGEIAYSGIIVKLGILGFLTHSLVFVGTTTGKIGKIYVDTWRSELLERFKIVQRSFPVVDIQVQNQNVYVMTENVVVNIADNEPCPVTVHCLECMKSEIPACGWHILSQRCTVNIEQTTWWLPSLGRQCLKVTAQEVIINDTTNNVYPENISVQFKFHPDVPFYNISCWNDLNNIQAMRIMEEYFECVLPVGDEQFQLNVTYGIPQNTFVLGTTTVKVLKCSAFSSCGACVNTHVCFWCIGTVSCVRHAAACTTADTFSMTEDQCPRITSTKVLIHAGGTTVLTESLRINVDNLYKYGNKTDKLRCVVGEEEYAVVVDNSYTFVSCQNVTAPGTGIRTLYLTYNGARLDNSVELEVYACMDFSSSCGICKHYNNEGYKCDWCGSCKTTIGGAPETCKQDQIVQCQLSVSGVYPSAGPEFGGTLINITGSNIGNRGDNISVTIDDINCTNVAVIEPSTVISCITCNGSASTEDGVVVTVNGINSPLPRHMYTFQSQIELLTFSPNTSILSGGRNIAIQGTHIGFIGSRYNISFCNDMKCLVCRFLHVEGDHTCICKIDSSDSVITFTYLTVTIDGNTHLTLNKEFLVVADPLVIPLSLDNATVFKSGGQKLTITGTGFSNAGLVIVDTPKADPCTILSDNIVVCKVPPYIKSDFDRRKRSAIQNIYVNFDNYRVSLGIFYMDDPLLKQLSKVYEYVHNAVLEIKGSRLLQGARYDDYLIRVGLDGLCIIIEVTNYNITCLPPTTKPRTDTGDLVFILVVVGNINELVGYLRYESSTSENNSTVLYGVAGGGLAGVLVIISVIALMMRRSMKKKADNTNTEMKEIKEKVSKMVTKEDVVGLSTGSANSRTEFVEPDDEVYDEINAEEESNSNSNGNTYFEVTSGYEDLGQMSAINPYNQLQQTNGVDRDREIAGYLTHDSEDWNRLIQQMEAATYKLRPLTANNVNDNRCK
ncbi:plexin-A4-like [Mytilus edulis]|uniref:plexin-A4-like n=1 Tax=Mytilus edulis TaxID=6550 RepID=UPI0039F10F49